jgi:hypothetical protein
MTSEHTIVCADFCLDEKMSDCHIRHANVGFFFVLEASKQANGDFSTNNLVEQQKDGCTQNPKIFNFPNTVSNGANPIKKFYHETHYC